MSAATAVKAVLSLPAAPRGVVAAVSTPAGTDIFAEGTANTAGTPVSPGMSFDIASVTKVAATTTALIELVGSGILAVDDALERYVPGTACAPGTTLRHLLLHRAGLWEWQPLYFAPDPTESADTLPLRYPLDCSRHYSDLGFMLLGRVIAAATTMTLDAAVQELVLTPLGLRNTGFGPVQRPIAASSIGDTVERRMAESQEPYPVLCAAPDFRWREYELAGVVNDGNSFHAFGGVAGHAGLFSTAEDLLTLGCELSSSLAGDGRWPRDVLADFLRDGPDRGQALGWRSELVPIGGIPRRLLWHPGFTGCALGIIPQERTALVLLSNRLLSDPPTTTHALWAAALPPLLSNLSNM